MRTRWYLGGILTGYGLGLITLPFLAALYWQLIGKRAWQAGAR